MQLHCIPKKHLKECIRRINEIKLGTIAACGDVSRNVMCCPAPHHGDPIHAELQALADTLAAHFKPRTQAYYEIWLRDDATGEETLVGQDGRCTSTACQARVPVQRALSGNGHAADSWTLPAGPHAVDPVEPIYGPVYLPRKFKIAVGLADDNCVDLYANDIGLMAIVEGGQDHRLQRAGRRQHGLHARQQKHVSRDRQADVLRPPEQAIDVCTAIVKVQRDFGNRADRKLARMKYLIANWGLERFQGQGRRVLRPAARRLPPDRRHRLRRPPRLARARRRPLLTTA